MRRALIALGILAASASPSFAQLGMSFDIPGARIGINVPVYPAMQPVPGYPVYYAPGVNSNYFFYDGLYWVFDGENWYASSWYDGPWSLVDPLDVPLFVLRVPVRYYRVPPPYFRAWVASDAPHWGDRWGQSWEKRRGGWDHWNRGSAPAPAPLPSYQRQYSGSSYPRQSQQQASLEARNYRYQPKDAVAQQHFQQARTQAVAAPPQQQAQPQQAAQPHPTAPVAREQQVARPQQPAPVAREQQVARPQQAAPAVHEQQAARPQPPQRVVQQQVEHNPQHEQPAARPQAQAPQVERKPQERAPQGNEKRNEQGHEDGKEHDNK